MQRRLHRTASCVLAQMIAQHDQVPIERQIIGQASQAAACGGAAGCHSCRGARGMWQCVADVSQWCNCCIHAANATATHRCCGRGGTTTSTHLPHAQKQLVGEYGWQMLSAAL